MDIAIIGGGPSGLYLANLLKDKYDLKVFEEHGLVGYPVHCTGLVSEDVLKFTEKRVILNKIKGAIIHISNESLAIEKKGTAAYVIDRKEFDRGFYENVSDNVLKNERVKSIKRSGDKYIIESNNTYQSKMVIGADGARSFVRNMVIKNEIKLLNGIQFVIKNKNFMGEYVHVYLDRKYSDGFFSWIVPREDDILIGLATYDNEPISRIKLFIKSTVGDIVPDMKVAGQIPIGFLPIHSKENIYLTGDAALFVKATSGGGLYYGLRGSQILAETIIENESYEKNLKSMLKELKTDYLIHRIFSKMDDKDLLKLILTIKKEGFIDLINEYGDIDRPSLISRKIIFNGKFIYFYPFLLKIIIKSILMF